MTNGEKIRSMSDEELERDLLSSLTWMNKIWIDYCKNKPECEAILKTWDELIPEDWCRQCRMKWLKGECKL